MSGFQFSAATINALLGSAAPSVQNKNTNGTQKDEFSSLLDVVGANNDVNAAPNVASPVQFSQALPKPERDSQSDTKPTLVKPAPAKRDDAEKNASAKTDAKSDRAPHEKVAIKKNNKNDDQGNDAKVVATADAPKPVQQTDTQASQAVNESDAPAASDASQEKSSERVDSLSNLLNILGALLAKAGGALSQLVNNTQATSNLSLQSGDAGAVVANTQDVLQNIQQLLQTSAGEGATLSQDAQAQLDALNNALAKDISALKDLFAQATKTTAAADTVISAEPLTQNLPVLDNAKDLLKNDIANIRSALQKFKAAAQPAPVQTQTIDVPAPELAVNIKPETFAKNAETPVAAQAVVAAQPEVNVVQNNAVQNVAVQGAAAEQASLAGNQNFGGQSGQQSSQQNNNALTNISALSANTQNTASDVQRSSFSGLLSRTSQTPVTQQVVFHVKNAAIDGSSKIHIQLDPETLGKLDIKLHVDAEGKTGVTIIADKQGTLELLQKDSQGLQKALADAGLKTDEGSLSFNLRGGQQERNQGQNGSQAAANYRKTQPEEEIAPLAVLSRSYVVNMPDGLDIKI